MKVLDPQAAFLTSAEVHQFLQSTGQRKAEKQIGNYPTTNLSGYTTVRKDFDIFTREIVPHVRKYAPAEDWIRNVVKRVKEGGYELTKSEVLNLIDLGVGARRSPPGQQNGDGGEDGEDADASVAREIEFFKAAVEEADERFPGAEGEQRIREVIDILSAGITLKSDSAGPSEQQG